MTHAAPRAGARVFSSAIVVVLACIACTPAGAQGHAARSPSGAALASAACAISSSSSVGSDRAYTVPIDPALAGGSSRRTASVHIPAGYRPHSPAPLVLEFHGAGPDATAAGYEQGSPLRQVSDRSGFIDVFPQGLRYPNGNLGWNAYGPVIVTIAEIPFVNLLLDAVERDYCVDTARVYASGISNGANMVNYLACRDAGRIAAVAPVVGPMFGQDDGPCRPSRPVPILDIHSVNDPAVPYGGHPGPPDYEFPLPSVTEWLEGWAKMDGCRSAPGSAAGPDGVELRTWTACGQGARIAAYATRAGHGWPASLDGRPAAEVVWEFLSAFRL